MLMDTCVLNDKLPCVQYMVASSATIPPMQCICKGDRKKEATSAEHEAIRQHAYKIFVDSLFHNESNKQKSYSKDDRQCVVMHVVGPEKEGKPPSSEPAKKAVRFEDSPETSMFPTDQANRQKKQKQDARKTRTAKMGRTYPK